MKSYLKNPYLITLITIVIFLGILKLPLDLILDNFDLTFQQSNNLERIFKNIIIVLLSVVTIRKLGFINISGLSKRIKFQHKFLVAIPLYLVFFGVISTLNTNLSGVSIIDIILLSLAMLSVGFVEEFIFRGLLQSVFLKKYINHKNGIYISIFIPALLFGLLHLINLDMNNIAASVSQVIYAFMIGSAFGAILLKTNKLIPLAIIHGLIDIVFSLNTLLDDEAIPGKLEQQSISDAIGSMVFVLPLFIAGLLIIRKISRADIINKLAY